MSHSNHTSFMTAEPGSTRNSVGSTIEQHIQYPYYNNHHSSHQAKNNPSNKHDGELPRSKSILRKKHNLQPQYNNRPIDNNRYEHHSLKSSFSSEDLQSSHTVVNESPQSGYNFKEKSNVMPNAERHPNQVVTNTESIIPKLKTYPIAWVLLFLIVVLRAAIAIFGNTFSPIPSVTAEFMGISLSSINWIYNVMAICYIIASFFTSWLYQTIGVKWSVSIRKLCKCRKKTIRNIYLP
jgi:hypothetical protein